jgi:hypothetical protein
LWAQRDSNVRPKLEAVSQNLVHASRTVTDGVYGVLSALDVIAEIAAPGKGNISEEKHQLAQILVVLRRMAETSR